jgi:hypothetical protein
VITGLQAYKYYMAVKLHLTTKDFNVFVNPRIKCSQETYNEKATKSFFDKLGRSYSNTDLVDLYVANLLYGSTDFIYNETVMIDNHKRWKKIKGSLTYTFKNDLNKILQTVSVDDFYNNLFNLFIGKKINPETYFLLNELDQVIDKITIQSKDFFYEDLMKIKKLKGFIKYDTQKISAVYKQFKEELEVLK